jgi:hypothetical protein
MAIRQEGGKARDVEKGEVQGPAGGHVRDETRGQEKAAAEDSGKRSTRTSGKMPVETTTIDVIEEPVPTTARPQGGKAQPHREWIIAFGDTTSPACGHRRNRHCPKQNRHWAISAMPPDDQSRKAAGGIYTRSRHEALIYLTNGPVSDPSRYSDTLDTYSLFVRHRRRAYYARHTRLGR